MWRLILFVLCAVIALGESTNSPIHQSNNTMKSETVNKFGDAEKRRPDDTNVSPKSVTQEKMVAARRLHALIMGAPGSGKGTISERLVKSFDMLHVSSGDMLRKIIREKTDLGVEVNKFVSNGQLVPDELMLKIIGGELNRLSSSNRSWLLDGFPRTKSQALSLYKIAPVDLVISLEVPFNVIIDRVKGRWIHEPSGRVYNTDFNAPKVPGHDDVTGELLVQREDDKPESVKKRLEIYSKMASPILEYYSKKNLVAVFLGETTNEIWPEIYDYLATKIDPIAKLT